jgi:hypothetical protein
MNSPKKILGMFAALAILSLAGTALASKSWTETYIGKATSDDFRESNIHAALNVAQSLMSRGADSDHPCHNGYEVSHKVIVSMTQGQGTYTVTMTFQATCSDTVSAESK